jgi:hypothetical protein
LSYTALDVGSAQRKISVLLTQSQYERFCAFCRDKGYKKSTLVSRLIREFMDAEHYASQEALFRDDQSKSPE